MESRTHQLDNTKLSGNIFESILAASHDCYMSRRRENRNIELGADAPRGKESAFIGGCVTSLLKVQNG
jgi:hypothetical protein